MIPPDEKTVPANPLLLFGEWMAAHINSGVAEPAAAVISTVGESGRPSSRIVLLRSYDNFGFSFFTNYNSRKATEISKNAYVAINFYWVNSGRQIRIEGKAVKLDDKTSDDYFSQRPQGHKINAWASEQSSRIKNRAVLEESFDLYQTKFSGQPIPRPPHWGGYCVIPESIEFWQSGANRLHDRILYKRKTGAKWQIFRLAP